MFKKLSGGLLAVTAIALSGCAGIPQLDIQSPVTVANPSSRIRARKSGF
jgi:starvation-inducible outer membrane lipoprotein